MVIHFLILQLLMYLLPDSTFDNLPFSDFCHNSLNSLNSVEFI